MNPTVGTFISMDSYDGSIDDPVSLHKYLYADANPVSNSDPSGYNTMADFETATGIQGVLRQIATSNPKALLDLVGGIFEVVRDTASSVVEGIEMGLEGPELAMHIASGLLTSLVTNFSCMLTKLGPFGYVLMGIAAVVIGVIAVISFAEGNTEMGLAQVANLVGIIFSMFNPACFTADTKVYSDCGLVCIEDIAVGDSVWAYDFETDETELKKVLNVWIKETDEILHLETSDGETIDTTTNHPFYVDGKGWVAAGDLEIGDTLVTAEGNEVEIADIEIERLAEPITVYNLEVEDFHTYFVGEYGVLVHNYPGKSQTANGDSFGSYSIEFESGKKYHGKGPYSRMLESIQEKLKKFNDKAIKWDWTPASSEEAFIDEFFRIINDGGKDNIMNYNNINSPGRRLYEKILNELFGGA